MQHTVEIRLSVDTPDNKSRSFRLDHAQFNMESAARAYAKTAAYAWRECIPHGLLIVEHTMQDLHYVNQLGDLS